MEVVSRDLCRAHAEAAREGAPQAKQVADRFHLLQNFRETIERQLAAMKRRSGISQINASDNHSASPLPETV